MAASNENTATTARISRACIWITWLLPFRFDSPGKAAGPSAGIYELTWTKRLGQVAVPSDKAKCLDHSQPVYSLRPRIFWNGCILRADERV